MQKKVPIGKFECLTILPILLVSKKDELRYDLRTFGSICFRVLPRSCVRVTTRAISSSLFVIQKLSRAHRRDGYSFQCQLAIAV